MHKPNVINTIYTSLYATGCVRQMQKMLILNHSFNASDSYLTRRELEKQRKRGKERDRTRPSRDAGSRGGGGETFTPRERAYVVRPPLHNARAMPAGAEGTNQGTSNPEYADQGPLPDDCQVRTLQV